MWNEIAMHHHQDDGRGQVSAWVVPLVLFVFMAAGSFFTGGAEPADQPGRLQAQIATTELAR